MGKTCRVVVCGTAGVGKTAVLEQVIYGTHRVGQVNLPNHLWVKRPYHGICLLQRCQGQRPAMLEILGRDA